MRPIIKRVLLAGAVATILVWVLATPEVITELLIFVPAFLITFGLLCVFPRKTVKKS